jgi:hypothetical protein
MSELKVRKKIVAITLDPELHDWFKSYSASKKKTVSGLVSEHIFDLSSSATQVGNG